MFTAFILIIINVLVSTLATAVNPSEIQLNNAEKQLQIQLNSITHEDNHEKKNELNNWFLSDFYEALLIEGSFQYPFDSLKNVGKLRSKDNRIRVFTWNIPQAGGGQKYFGFILNYHHEKLVITPLTDNRLNIAFPQLEKLSVDNWYGALYYDIQDVKSLDKTYYTLLGVDLNNIFSTKRIIDVLTINSQGELEFGHPIFYVRNKIINRVIFEYSARANMSLRWDEKIGMIVFDHLMPLRPSYAGKYQFYVPDLSFDGFKWVGTHWQYMPDVDIRNPERIPSTPIVAPDDFEEPGFIYVR